MGGVFKQLAENKSPAAHISEHRKRLHKLCEEVKASAPNVAPQGQGNSSHVPDPLRDKLMLLADEVLAASEKFELKLVKYEIKAQKPKSKPKIWKEAFKYSVFEKKKIDDLHESMRNYENTMQTSVLVDLQKRVGKLDEEIIKRLDDKTQHFALQVNAGFTRLEDIIQVESKSIQTLLAAQLGHTDRTVVENAEATQKGISVSERNIKDHVDLSIEKLRHENIDQLQIVQAQKLLNSIDFSERNARYNAISSSHKSTFGWIFDPELCADQGHSEPTIDRKAFTAWAMSNEPFFWISGKPGSGKSTLMKYLLEHSQTQQLLRSVDPQCIIISAFIWNAGSMEQRGLKFIIASLLHGLLTERADIARVLVSQNHSISSKRSLSDWSQDSLEATLLEASSLTNCNVCLFVDGLDEVDDRDGNGQYEILRLIDRLRNVPNIKICVSSRPEPLIREQFENLSHWRLQDLTQQDLRIFITATIAPYWEKATLRDQSKNTLSKLVNLILDKADGVFLWVYLVVSSIRNGIIKYDDWDMLVARLKDLPSKLHDLYNSMWNRLNEDTAVHRSQAAFYFRLILARRMQSGLSCTAFNLLFASNDRLRKFYLEGGIDDWTPDVTEEYRSFENQLVNRCGGFIDIRPRGKSTRTHEAHFIHKSAADFLQSTRNGQTILSYDETADQDIYVRLLCADLITSTVHGAYYDTPEDFIEVLFNGSGINRSLEDSIKLLYLDLVKSTLDRMGWWKDPGFRFEYHAALGGQLSYIKQQFALFDPSEELSLTQWKSHLLAHACIREPLFRGNINLIVWLLEQGADPNLPLATPTFFGGTPFQCFLQRVYLVFSLPEVVNTALVKEALDQFLAHGADVNTLIYAQLVSTYVDIELDRSIFPAFIVEDLPLNDDTVDYDRKPNGSCLIVEVRNACTLLNERLSSESSKNETASLSYLNQARQRGDIIAKLLMYQTKEGNHKRQFAKEITSSEQANLVLEACCNTKDGQQFDEIHRGLDAPIMNTNNILEWIENHYLIAVKHLQQNPHYMVFANLSIIGNPALFSDPSDTDNYRPEYSTEYRPEYSRLMAEVAKL